MLEAEYEKAALADAVCLDAVRDAVCAAAGSPAVGLARPAHVLRISHILRSIVDAEEIGLALDRLELLTECLRLPHGYWLPSPARYVNAFGVLIVLAPFSTDELSRFVNCEVRRAGSGRVVESAPSAIPEQDYWSWTGAPRDSAKWTETLLERARGHMAKTSLDSNLVDVHAPPVAPGTNSAAEPGIWRRLVELRSFEGVTLCRARLGRRSFRYFLARLSGGRVTHEAETEIEARARLRYGLDLLAGRVHRIRVSQGRGSCSFELYRPLPNEELRLLHALSTASTDHARMHVSVRTEFLNAIQIGLRPLGIILEVSP